MLRRTRSLLAISLLLVTSGCCSFLGFFCGPDRSPWVSKTYATPKEAIATFLEAIRRDDSRQIYRSLSQDFKDGEGLTGALEFELAWRQLKQRYGYLHLLGTARVRSGGSAGESFQSFELEFAGRRFQVGLRRQDYISLRYQVEGLTEPISEGRYVESLDQFLRILPPTDDGTIVQLTLTEIQVEGLQASELLLAEIGREWKVDSFGEIKTDL